VSGAKIDSFQRCAKPAKESDRGTSRHTVLREQATTIRAQRDGYSGHDRIKTLFEGGKVSYSVSIVINNYNYGQYLKDAIDSALNQTVPAREIVVVDDGSTDNSRAIIEAYADLILPVFQENGGQRKAYNSGFRVTSGDLILFLDADDILDSTLVEETSRAWKAGASKLHFPLRVASSISDHKPLPIVPQDGLPEGDLLPVMLRSGYYLSSPGSGNVYSRDFLKKILPMPESSRYCADTITIFSAPFYGNILAIHQPLGIYRLHGGNGYTGTETSSDDIQRFIENDFERIKLIETESEKRGLEFRRDCLNSDMHHIKLRLAQLRLNPQVESFGQVGVARLALRGIRAAVKRGRASTRRRLLFVAWFAVLAMAPARMVRRVVSLGFAKTGSGLPDLLSRTSQLFLHQNQ
jgi:glycosyltransferase involved in cell wall biosynthesis